MKARVTAVGVTDDGKDGVVEVRMVDSGTRLTIIAPVSVAVDMARTGFLGAEVQMEITLTVGDKKAHFP